MSGHRTLPISGMHFYQASKFAVTALTQGLRQEIKERKSNIRISVSLRKFTVYKLLVGSTPTHHLLTSPCVRFDRPTAENRKESGNTVTVR